MAYLVSLQEVDVPWGFTERFSEEDRDALLEAAVGQRFAINSGHALLNDRGEMHISLKSHSGIRHHTVYYRELCFQLTHPDSVKLFGRK